ncbi:MAG TPA: oligosaccharide flippase family protein [Candidatus Binatia bacterium]|nr:oligosaccharide flippase family protein [Candidatus Binatia bacterium]
MMPARASALRRVVGNSVWLVGAEAATRAVSLTTILYLTRTLAVAGMGTVEFGMAVFGVMQVLALGGIETLGMRRVAHRPGRVARLAGRALLVAWAQFAVAFAILAVVLALLPRPPVMRWAAILYGLAAFSAPLGVRFALIARERTWVIGVATVLCQIVFLALCVAGVHGPADVLRVPLFWIVAVAVRSSVQLAALVAGDGWLRFDRHRRVLVRWMRAAIGLGAGSVARGLMLVVDVLALGLLVAPEDVARYGIANKIPLFLASLTVLVYMTLFPTLARAAFAGDRRRLGAIQSDALKAMLGVALPGALCLSLVAEPLVVLLFTDKFLASVPLFRLLVWRFPIATAAGLFRASLWAQDPARDARVALQILVVGVVAAGLGAAVGGPSGAAVAMLIADGIALGLYVFHAGAENLRLADRAWVARVAIAFGLVAAVGLVEPHAVGLGGLAVAGASWGGASLLADLAYVRRLWGEMRRAATPAALGD